MSKSTNYIWAGVAVLALTALIITLYLIFSKRDSYVQVKNHIIQPPPQQQYSGISPLSYEDSANLLQARVWQTAIKDYTENAYNIKTIEDTYISGKVKLYPEKCYLRQCSDPKKVGLALAGGGSRGAIAALGFTRFLEKNKLFKKCSYVSTSSGSSWYVPVYLFAKNKGFPRNRIIGQSILPQNMNFDNLQNTNNYPEYYPQRMNDINNLDNVKKIFLKFLALNADKSLLEWKWEWWALVIGEIFLRFYRINDDVPIAVNKTHADQINKYNGNQFGDSILTTDTDDPFWLCNSTMNYNYTIRVKDGSLIINYPKFILLTYTPLYSGLTNTFQLTDGSEIGGYAIETFAFNQDTPMDGTLKYSERLSCNNQGYNINIKKKNKIFSLKDMSGASSGFFQAPWFDIQNILKITGISRNSLNFGIWKTNSMLENTKSDDNCHYSWGNCYADDPYNSQTCTNIGLKCYSKSAPQCTHDSDCSFNFATGMCTNNDKSKSDLNCRYDLKTLKCKCLTETENDITTNAVQTDIVNVYDSGMTDNSGILAMVSRGVKKIISIYSVAGSLFDEGDNDLMIYGPCGPLKSNTASTPNFVYPFLFGANKEADCTPDTAQGGRNLNKIFDENDYPDFVDQLKTNFQKGHLPFARKKLKVQPNPLHGIETSYQLDLLVIVIDKSTNFYNAIQNPELKNDLLKNYIAKPLMGAGAIPSVFPLSKSKWASFPFVDTAVVGLTLAQSNLYSSYVEWCVSQEPLRSQILSMYK